MAIKEFISQITIGDYIIGVLATAFVYWITGSFHNRLRNQLTAFFFIMIISVRLLSGITYFNLVEDVLAKIHFIYFWAPFCFCLFLTGLTVDKTNLKKVLSQNIIIAASICVTLYIVFK